MKEREYCKNWRWMFGHTDTIGLEMNASVPLAGNQQLSIKIKKTTLTAVHCRDSHAVLHKDSQAGNRQLPNTSTFYYSLLC